MLVELPIQAPRGVEHSNFISFCHIPFLSALYMAEYKESPGIFSLVVEGYKARNKNFTRKGLCVYIK
jgi:hypothetical protein